MPSEFNCPTNCGTLSIDEDRLANAGGVAANRAITKYSCPELHQIGDILGLAMRGSVRVVQMCFYLKMSFSHDGLSFPFTFCSRRNRYGGIAKERQRKGKRTNTSINLQERCAYDRSGDEAQG